MNTTIAFAFTLVIVMYLLIMLSSIKDVKKRGSLKQILKFLVQLFGIVIIINFFYNISIEEFYFHISDILIGIAFGWIMGVLSIAIVNKFKVIILFPFTTKLKKCDKKRICIFFLTCFVEEIIWRCYLLSLYTIVLNNSLVAIILISFLFVASHIKRKIKYLSLLDLLIFSILISSIYLVFDNLMIIYIAHLFRNIIVIFYGRSCCNERVINYENNN